MAMIQAEHLTFAYEGSPENVFEDLSFRLDTDWRLGLIARNGKGKTTLLRLMMGELDGRGNITVPVPMEYFPPRVADKNKITIDVVEAVDPGYELWKVCRECNLLDLDTEVLYRPFQTLSNGQQTKVLLAVLFAKESGFLLIDEPTNHLDVEAREAIGAYLQNKKGFILVSHDRTLLDTCVNHVMVLNRQDMEIRQGNFSAWWEDKQKQDAYELKENDRLKREIGRLESAARKSRGWADKVESQKIGKSPLDSHFSAGTRPYLGEKSRKMQMRRKNLERRQGRAIDEKKELLKNLEEPELLKLMPLEHHKQVLVEAKDCSLAYPGKTALRDFSLTLKKGEKVFLQGRNGCGKSSVLKAVISQALAASGRGCMLTGAAPSLIGGTLHTAAGLLISYVPQDASFLRGSLREFAREQGIEETLFFTLLRKLDFSREHLEHEMQELSAGQKKKVLLAQSLCTRAHLYIWDEPLNYIDVFSRIQIEELLGKAEFTLLAVEHDKAFCNHINGRAVML